MLYSGEHSAKGKEKTMITRYEVEAYLGPALEELTEEQIDDLISEFQDIAHRYDEDDPSREAAWAAAVEYMLGNTNADQASDDYQKADLERKKTLAAAIQVTHMAGMTHSAAAQRIGISRNTLRSYLGNKKKHIARKKRLLNVVK